MESCVYYIVHNAYYINLNADRLCAEFLDDLGEHFNSLP